MSEIDKTVFHEKHVALGAKMVEFAGWEMPLHYRPGIIEEHLTTRKRCGLFDVSHMGRFLFRGAGALKFLQHALTNNAVGLEVGEAQYTIIPDAQGGAIDDAYLYHFFEDEYLLVVNAANRQKDRDHFRSVLRRFKSVELLDQTKEMAMLSLQGPLAKEILTGALDSPFLPEPKRNALITGSIQATSVLIGRTGYTGEPLSLEVFVARKDALAVWDTLTQRGASPAGLGARDTLRLEACLPLHGHELGKDPEGKEIPVFACPLSQFAVSFSPDKGEFIGKKALEKQRAALKRILFGDYSRVADLPRRIMPLVLIGKAVARRGAKVFAARNGERHVGYVTSGTMVPYWLIEGEGLESRLTEEKQMRAICLGLLDSDLREDDPVTIEIRDRKADAVVVPFYLRSEAPPLARTIVYAPPVEEKIPPPAPAPKKAQQLLEKALENTIWRQRQCVNLIPSEQTASPMTRLLSIMDPAFRYAEHKSFKAFNDAEVFYYQGVDFIAEVERLLAEELRAFLGCREVETRLVSGQMANATVFSAMVDYINRANRKAEPRRIRKVMNNDIIKGGHLSSQPMGALRDFVARDPKTEKPAVVNFPILPENPYKIDVSTTCQLIAEHEPELIVFGKSVVLHPEPVAEIRACVDELGLSSVIMYDMAHVVGLVGPHFQEPFKDGADVVTGSTHKTFFGTQRGMVAVDYDEHDIEYELWESIRRRTFPGAVSNHHLGTLVGLLMAAYEMNHFKDAYQKAVLANAKAFAKALNDLGMDVAGDPAVSFTETHQVVINVGYGKGPEVARRLEDNNIIVNYQAGPYDEGFSAAGSLRMGVAEMTRFGMQPKNFQTLAQLIHDVVEGNRTVIDKVKSLRKQFLDLRFCFSGKEYDELIERLHSLI